MSSHAIFDLLSCNNDSTQIVISIKLMKQRYRQLQFKQKYGTSDYNELYKIMIHKIQIIFAERRVTDFISKYMVYSPTSPYIRRLVNKFNVN